MTPPPPPPPPTPGATVPIAPPVTPNLTASVPGPPKGTPFGKGGDHTDQLMAAIRNGINLKPAKTNDRSTAAFIKQANGVLDDNDEPAPSVPYDKSTSIDEMKDALQAELRNTLKRKIKKQDLEEGDCRKNEEIERSIELTRNEVQLKLNGPSPTPDTPKVDNPLKTIVDLVDKERGIAPVKQPSPELLSPQVRSGAASIRPSQIRTLTKAGSVVSHTDILETAKPVNKLPVTLVEPAPVLTAAAAVSPPPKVPSANNTAPLPSPSPAKVERTPLFEKANKEPPKSPLNRWADSSSSSGNSSVSGGTARKLLLTHGRPNFTIKRSNSRQGFDVDVADSKTDSAKPVFRILTDLEKMEQQADEGNQTVVTGPSQQAYVSFAKDLANAPNNHPDVVVVTKTSSSTAPTNPFLANLKDIKIDISEMKIVNAKNA
uniref:WH2 domain-containing protein n=1 Tax=Anopheles melas TaxID=34690 RepID=A0A182TTN1_9DIPT